MTAPTDEQRHLRRGAALARKAAASFAAAADHAHTRDAKTVARVVVSGPDGPAVACQTIEQAIAAHGTVDVLVIAAHHHGPEHGAQEDPPHGT